MSDEVEEVGLVCVCVFVRVCVSQPIPNMRVVVSVCVHECVCINVWKE